MVIFVSREGQLANRIFQASFFIVNAQEHDYQLRHFFFDDYYSFFSESLGRNKTKIRFWCKKTSKSTRLFQKAVILFTRGLLKIGLRKLPFLEHINYETWEQDAKYIDLNDENYLRKAKSQLVLVSGWLFRDTINFGKYKGLLTETWKPNKYYSNTIDNYYKKYKQAHDVLIGVHIRGGDYKTFEGGKWYYTPEQYYLKMKELASLKMFEEKKIGFVICASEKDVSLPGGEFFSVFNESRHFVEDLYLLAKCDYIIGPPSTYSMWASFYGNVPLHMLNEIDPVLTDQSFAPQVTSF